MDTFENQKEIEKKAGRTAKREIKIFYMYLRTVIIRKPYTALFPALFANRRSIERKNSISVANTTLM